MTYKQYKYLNHLMIRCESVDLETKATPDEYNMRGHVDGEVIADIVEWVKGCDK